MSKCLLFIKVILFLVQVSKQEKKGEGDIRLNNLEILSSVTFTPVPVRFLADILCKEPFLKNYGAEFYVYPKLH